MAIDKAWRRRQDAFWKRVEQSPYGRLVDGALMLGMLGLAVLCFYSVINAASDGVVRGGYGGTTRLSENPAWFSARVGLMFVAGVCSSALGVLGLWLTVFPRKRKPSKRRNKAPSLKRPNDHE